MGSMTAFEVIDRLAALGCAVRVDGGKLRVRGPNLPEIAGLVSELRARRDDALAILGEAESKPPSLDEVNAALPPGVRLLKYEPKQAPFAIAPVSVITDAGKFYRAYLRDLIGSRLASPQGCYCPSLADILTKLADAGLELTTERLS